jgi:hypothetical protein
MFDLSTVNRRYFSIKLNDLELEVEPPKLKALKKITSLSKARDEDAIEDLAEAVGMILSKNKKKYVVPNEVIDELDLDQMSDILTAYFEWLGKEKTSKN